MSKLADQIVGLLKDGPLTVYEMAARMNRTEAGLKTMIFEMRVSGYIEAVSNAYPRPYRLTEKAKQGPVKLAWRKTEQSRRARERREVERPVPSAAVAIANRPLLQTIWR